MPGYYTYLLSSLPMLHFGNPPPLSFQKFIQLCEGVISEEDINILKNCAEDKAFIYKGSQSTLRKWYAFEIALRNELVKSRSQRKHVDAHRYIRDSQDAEPFVSRIAISAVKNPSLIESERMLDQERWRFLDELAIGHYFDLDSLIVYVYKLLILERWERIRKADKARLLEEVLSPANN